MTKKHDMAREQIQRGHAEKLRAEKELNKKDEEIINLKGQIASLKKEYEE
jgi:hypothetical protein